MTTVTVFGKGNMGQAIGQNFIDAGNDVNYIEANDKIENIGNIVVLAVPYDVATAIAKHNVAVFENKIVIDISNPLNFETWDSLVVPADSSAAAQIAEILPKSTVVKGFNTTFAGTLVSKKIGDSHQTTVQLASDNDEAKQEIIAALENSGLNVIDAGSLKRARELEAVGFLQMTLAVKETIGWTGGFGLFK